MVIEKILELKSEINCRAEHGAEGEAHLRYIEKELEEILPEVELIKKKCKDQHKEITSRGQKIERLSHGLDGLSERNRDIAAQIKALEATNGILETLLQVVQFVNCRPF